MSDLLAPGATNQTNLPEFSPSELSGKIKRTLESAFDRVRLRGELGRVTVARSGHFYFDIKDDGAVISSVMWKGNASRLSFQPEEGLEVIAEGKLSTFAGQSRYQLIADKMAPAGAGALMALLEERKKKLAGEGLFDPSRKRPIPYLPKTIGVVTSPTGAVIRDILHRIRDRFPCHVLVWPSLVQGDKASQQIIAGIEGFNNLKSGGELPAPDVIIVARGGGSLEDLWCFNDEGVVRATAASKVPLISAVGHETDTTLIDYASDFRAPTPTGAAEKAVPVRAELQALIEELSGRHQASVLRYLERKSDRFSSLVVRLPKSQNLLGKQEQTLDFLEKGLRTALASNFQNQLSKFRSARAGLRPMLLKQDLSAKSRSLMEIWRSIPRQISHHLAQKRLGFENMARRIVVVNPVRDLSQKSLALEGLSRRLIDSTAHRVNAYDAKLQSVGTLLETLSYSRTLERGYALVRDEKGEVVKKAKGLNEGQILDIQFTDKAVSAKIDAPTAPLKANPSKGKAKTSEPQKSKASKQGDLF